MRIKKLILKNFRQFENLELDFTDENGNVLDVVVFAGVNGSGKSTILNFLSDFFKYLNEEERDNNSLLENVEFLIEFGEKYIDELNLLKYIGIKNKLDDFKKEDFHYPLSSIFQIFKYIDKGYYFPQSNQNISLVHLFDRGSIELINYFNKLRTELITFEVTEQYILKEIQSIVFKDKHQAPFTVIQNTINALNTALKTLKTNTRLTDIESERLVFSNGIKNDLTFNDLSNGEKQLFFQIFTLHNLHLNNGIMLIDEPEDAMHPTWQREILNVYKNIGIDNQVFVATHSPHILSSVKPESLFVLNINEETGKINAFNMAKERKNTKGLDPNRILTEIMGAPLRDYETQQRIDDLNNLIKAANAAPNGNIQTIEDNLQELTTDLGRQDYNIMLFNNELMLLKRKKSKMEVA